MRPTLVAMLLLAVAERAPAQDAGTLVGRWRSVKTSSAGIGAMYEFHPGGRIDFMPGVILPMDYRLEGDQLILPPDTAGGPEQKSTIQWTDDGRLRIVYNNQAAEEYQRQDAAQDSEHPLYGEWAGTRHMDGRAIGVRLFFFPSGKALLLLSFVTRQGTYAVAAGQLRAAFPPEGSLNGAFTVKDGLLSVTRPDGRVTQFVRY